MHYPKHQIPLANKISAYIAGMSKEDATKKITMLIANYYRRKQRA